MPVFFVLSALGGLMRAVVLIRRRRGQPDVEIDYAELNRKEFTPRIQWLKDNIRGHDAVIDRVGQRLQQGLALGGPNQTLGSFLLVGPTGTGKTFLGELVAKALYPESEVVELRMNQYKDPDDVFTLIGPPPGYPGYEVGGALTRPLLENPYRVVILDEFEKSHPDVRHCLYDILDTAQCREKSSGKTISFGACAFFATCNSGVDTLRAIWKQTEDPIQRADRAREALAREGFERALLARFDEVLFMDELPPLEVAEVACLQLAKHWRQYGMELTYTSPEILVEAVRRNMSFQEYGVRQLAHFIREITTPSIESARKEGAKRVRLDFSPSGQITVATVDEH
ncbi:MAG: AAA family ATPase [Elusimicrobiota bacterium]